MAEAEAARMGEEEVRVRECLCALLGQVNWMVAVAVGVAANSAAGAGAEFVCNRDDASPLVVVGGMQAAGVLKMHLHAISKQNWNNCYCLS